jgi:hypothetical protein
MNSREEDAAFQPGGENGMNDVDVDMNEQYRIMAQMEANLRVKDNTGFDMIEYKEQQQLRRLEEERQQQESRGRGRYHTKPKPQLPDVGNSNFPGGIGDNDTSKGYRPEEPPLPFTRANRRYVQSGRGNNNRTRVPEICRGVVVPKHSSAASSKSTGSTEHLVECWGCSSVADIYLRVNILATLVQCPECSTVSPVMQLGTSLGIGRL